RPRPPPRGPGARAPRFSQACVMTELLMGEPLREFPNRGVLGVRCHRREKGEGTFLVVNRDAEGAVRRQRIRIGRLVLVAIHFRARAPPVAFGARSDAAATGPTLA